MLFKSAILSLVILILCAPLSLCKEAGSLARGKKIFESHLCADCHKGGGNSVRPSKPISGKKFSKKYKNDAKLVKVIRKGVPNRSMPSFGTAVISDDEMKDLILYIRSFSQTAKKVEKSKSKKRK